MAASPSRLPPRRVAAAAVWGTVALLLAACGADPDDPPGGIPSQGDAGVGDVALPDADVLPDAGADAEALGDVGSRDVDPDAPDTGSADVEDVVPGDAGDVEADGDPDALRVVSVDPAAGGVGVPLDATVVVTFSHRVAPEAATGSRVAGACEQTVHLLDAAARCVGVRTVAVSGASIRYTPRQRLRPGHAYTLVVPAGVASDDGATLADQVRLEFTTVAPQPARTRTITIDGTDDFVPEEAVPTTDGKRISLTWDDSALYVGIANEDLTRTNMAAYVVVGAHTDADALGVAHVPGARWFEGSTVYLPFHASHVFFVKAVDGVAERYQRRFEGVVWEPRETGTFEVAQSTSFTELRIPRAALGDAPVVDVAVYLRDLASDCVGTCEPGWGWTFGGTDTTLQGGPGERILSTFYRLQLAGAPVGEDDVTLHQRFARASTRLHIYQALVRTFGNLNTTRTPNGTLQQNDTGRLSDFNDAAAAGIRELGATHVWLTGIPQHATSTDWSDVGEPADDPDILKGRAGSPYAVRDWFDVTPDLATSPAQRLAEFEQTVARLQGNGLGVLIDWVPNHVARSYRSTVHPELDPGQDDTRDTFFDPRAAFFYLQDGTPPLLLPSVRDGVAISPTCAALAATGGDYQCDGLFDWGGLSENEIGRVTGNNTASWTPSLDTWYETVKLNFGYDYTRRVAAHPQHGAPGPVPPTWQFADEVIRFWQARGVDGFRVDMAHMVPMELHSYVIARSRVRNPDVFWVAEAYNTDPARVTDTHVLHALLGAGFDAVYDDDTYDRLKEVFDGSAWANDLDGVLLGDPILMHHALRYAENHDEVRLASAHDWRFGGQNVGRTIGPAVTTLLAGLGRGPSLLYHGQEVGEDAAGIEGFGGDDGRTSIFDYWSLPALQRWANDHRYDGGALLPEEAALRARYAQIPRLLDHPAVAYGETWLLNSANQSLAAFGREADQTVSGQYAYAYLRYLAGRAVLVYVWLHPTRPNHDAAVRIPTAALDAAGLTTDQLRVAGADTPDEATLVDRNAVLTDGLALGSVEPGGVRVVWLGVRE